MVMIAALASQGSSGAKAMAIDGLTTIRSHFGPEETMARLKAAVIARGMTVFAHIDHADAAAKVNLKLPPTDLLIFGSPKGGTLVMQVVQTSAIDLPLKTLVWQDEAGTTWLSYNDPTWLAARHHVGTGAKAAVDAMVVALDAVTSAAVSASSGDRS
jgi:uncharacterized protein (DUF302 family)